MNKLTHLFLATFVAGMFTTPLCFAQKPEKQDVSGKIDWVYDYQEGQQLSKKTGRPMFVVFRCER